MNRHAKSLGIFAMLSALAALASPWHASAHPQSARSSTINAETSGISSFDLEKSGLLKQLDDWGAILTNGDLQSQDERIRQLIEYRAQYLDILERAKAANNEPQLFAQEKRFDDLKQRLSRLFPMLNGKSMRERQRYMAATIRALSDPPAPRRPIADPRIAAKIDRWSGLGLSDAARDQWYVGSDPRTMPSGAPVTLQQEPATAAAHPQSSLDTRLEPIIGLDDLAPDQVEAIANRLRWTPELVIRRIKQAKRYDVDWRVALATGKDPQILEGIIQNAKKRNLPVNFVVGLIKQESDFNPWAVSLKGAKGLMQLMKPTAQVVWWNLGMCNARSWRECEPDLHDIRTNLMIGTAHLGYLFKKYGGDLTLTAAAYNAGESAVDRRRTVPPFPETANFVSRILTNVRNYDSIFDFISRVASKATQSVSSYLWPISPTDIKRRQY